MNSHCKQEATSPDGASLTTFVGLDISKCRLDSFAAGGTPREDANTPQGHASLIAWLRGLPAPRVVCEATGGYEKAPVAALLEAGIEVCVVAPGRVRHFALAEGLLAKTDRIDARLLSRYGEKIRPPLELPADPAAVRLREMLEYRRVLSDQIVAAASRPPRGWNSRKATFARDSRRSSTASRPRCGKSRKTWPSISDRTPGCGPRLHGCASYAVWVRCWRPPCWPICPSWDGSTARRSPR